MRKFLTPAICSGLILGLAACGQGSSRNETLANEDGNGSSNQMVANDPANQLEQSEMGASERGQNPMHAAPASTPAAAAAKAPAIPKAVPTPATKAVPKSTPTEEPKAPVDAPACAPEHRAAGHC